MEGGSWNIMDDNGISWIFTDDNGTLFPLRGEPADVMSNVVQYIFD